MDYKSEKRNLETVTVEHVDSASIIRADDAKLAELGYKSEFRREFSVRCLLCFKCTLSYNIQSAWRPFPLHFQSWES